MVIVATLGADDEYVATKCGYASVSHESGSNSATITVTNITEVSGGKVSVMIWDNWISMSSIGSMYTVNL